MPLGIPLQYPSTTGARPSFGHIELRIAGFPFVGFKKIDYSRTRSREMIYGAHPDPLGKSLGQNEYKASCELYLPEFNLFLAQLDAASITFGYGDTFFDITVTYNAPGFGVVTDTLLACSLDSSDAPNGQGTAALTRTFELNPLKIRFGGKDDVTTPLGQVSIFSASAAVSLGASGSLGL
jgi:hypothetical protein